MSTDVLMIVRSVAGDRPAFERWSETDHMPAAVATLGALNGWRFWSEDDPAVHYAVYRFAGRAAVDAVPMEKR